MQETQARIWYCRYLHQQHRRVIKQIDELTRRLAEGGENEESLREMERLIRDKRYYESEIKKYCN